MSIIWLTWTLIAAGLLHVWLQLYNRRLLLMTDTLRKGPAIQLSFLLVVVLPLTALILLHRSPPIEEALLLRPQTDGARVVFACFAVLWVFLLWRSAHWFMDTVVPSRSRHILSDMVRHPRLDPTSSRLPLPLRPFETTCDLEMRRIELEVPTLAAEFDGLTLAQVSDLHLDSREGRMEWMEEVADLVNGADADVVIFTGDFINRRRMIEESVAFHARMKGRLATLAVLGNHDYWTRPKKVRRECQRHGIRLMHNRRWAIERAGRRLTFAGTDAPWGGRKTNWDRLRETGDETLILLSHTPDNAPAAARHGANLVLSGHNHGGQICLPFAGPLVVPSVYGHRFTAGVYDLGEESVLVVSRGVGCAGNRLNGRVLCRPEVILLTLRAPAAEAAVRVPQRQKALEDMAVAPDAS